LSLAAKLGKIAACTILCLAVFDIGGVVVSFVLEVAGVVSRNTSAALYYAIWFVLGVFCGILNYNTAGGFASPKSGADWTDRADASQTGRLICAISILLPIGLSVLFFSIFWSRGAVGDHYVPDSMPLTLTFFAAAAAATFLANHALRPVRANTN
jgi:hypothetical protein